MTDIEKNLSEYLNKNKIRFKFHPHKAVFTVKESDTLTNNIPGLRTKNLFLKDNKKGFYLICMPGHKRLNISSLRKKLTVKELHFGSPEELKSELNLTPGSVSIFGTIYSKNTSLIIDKEVWEAEIIGSHPNINNATLELTHENLERFYSSLTCKKQILEL